MEFTIKAGSPEKLKNGCVVAGVFAGGELSTAAKALDKASDGSIAAILSRGDLDDKAGATLTLHALPGLATPRVLLVSLGKAGELTDKTYRDAVSAAARQLAGSPADDAAFCLADVDLPGRDAAWRIAQAAQILKDSTYRCDELKSKKDESKKGVKKLVFVTRGKPAADLDAALLEGEAIAEGKKTCVDVGGGQEGGIGAIDPECACVCLVDDDTATIRADGTIEDEFSAVVNIRTADKGSSASKLEAVAVAARDGEPLLAHGEVAQSDLLGGAGADEASAIHVDLGAAVEEYVRGRGVTIDDALQIGVWCAADLAINTEVENPLHQCDIACAQTTKGEVSGGIGSHVRGLGKDSKSAAL